VAVAALTGALALGGPAFAQRYSTPDEQAQTRDLNDQAEPGTTATPEQLNGEAPLTVDQGEYQGPGSAQHKAQVTSQVTQDEDTDNDAAQQRYQNQQDNYVDQRERYLDSKDAYDAKKDAYDARKDQYEDERANYDAHFPDFPRDARLIRLGNVPGPEHLRDAPVDSIDGEHIGRVVAIENQGGAPRTVEVGIGRGRTVYVPSDALRYDRERDIIVSSATRDDFLDDFEAKGR
jgi:hypothetical protein